MTVELDEREKQLLRDLLERIADRLHERRHAAASDEDVRWTLDELALVRCIQRKLGD